MGHLIGLKQNPDFRTNLGFAEITGHEAEVSIRVFDSSGSQLLAASYQLPATGWLQVGLSEMGIANLDPGRAQIEVTSGGAVLSYASVVDNRTGDAVFLPAQKSGVSHQIVPVAARARGGYGTDWRTELVLFNPNSGAQNITLTYHAAGEQFSSALNLQPSALFSYNDLISQAFPQIQGATSGWLEISSATASLLSARIYNQTDQGTYGQGVKAGVRDQGLGVGEVGHLLQLTQNQDYRTNLGFTEITGQATDIAIRINDLFGTLLLTSAISLQPSAWRQISLSDLGVTSLDIGRAEVEVTGGGAVLSYASAVDNRTGDAIFVPAMK